MNTKLYSCSAMLDRINTINKKFQKIEYMYLNIEDNFTAAVNAWVTDKNNTIEFQQFAVNYDALIRIDKVYMDIFNTLLSDIINTYSALLFKDNYDKQNSWLDLDPILYCDFFKCLTVSAAVLEKYINMRRKLKRVQEKISEFKEGDLHSDAFANALINGITI